ncbi:SDR family NAD(P)-dependent oxidoreductase [Paenibacillus glacialis]|uniref:3-oxoacyl-ACP reductase n=1 Tax=Paenibacillus glacialis TaxID=494026 RepID=A0A168N365_9BACL|nr:SDR family oxidoreductase [Paenibacillus glacialis]OAB45336.1 3-oxoacyl-ACP reductase [Paenibacillus glacialis]
MAIETTVKCALITGASRGIGKAVALEFAKAGINVMINYFGDDKEALEVKHQAETYGVRAEIFHADVSEPVQVQELFEAIDNLFGRIDILVNNAGIAQAVSVTEMTDEQWDRMIKIHMYGTFYTSRAAARRMTEQKSGRIINVTSDVVSQGAAEFAHYAAAKGGITAFTKSLARELAPYVLVNAVAPGGTFTDIRSSLEETQDKNDARYLLNRLAFPQEIARSVLFLASDDGSIYTGQVLGANGGSVMNG